MKESILAGFMISIGAAMYLVVGGTLGAFLFAIGLLTILCFKFSLFTGKAGLLTERKISSLELLNIWIGNFCGAFIGACALMLAGLGPKIVEPATAIINKRISNTWYENLVLGIFCGILMYIAVTKWLHSVPFLTIMCVMGFILLGANHCVADMVYTTIATSSETWVPAGVALIWTTIGNIIGTNLIPLFSLHKEEIQCD